MNKIYLLCVECRKELGVLEVKNYSTAKKVQSGISGVKCLICWRKEEDKKRADQIANNFIEYSSTIIGKSTKKKD